MSLDYSALFPEPIPVDRVEAIREAIVKLPGLSDVGLPGHAVGLRFDGRTMRLEWSEDVSIHVDKLGVGVRVYRAATDECERLLSSIENVLNAYGIRTELVAL